MVHGGPYPATTMPSTTSVGTSAIYRFLRPVCYQDIPDQFLPEALRADNPLGIWRLINGEWKKLRNKFSQLICMMIAAGTSSAATSFLRFLFSLLTPLITRMNLSFFLSFSDIFP